MKHLPTDVSTFSTMIKDNYIYVDKTEYIYNLFKGGSRYYFLSRPRRFGKTLLISTLKELFQGNKDLFQGLKISSTHYKWDKHPVIHLDFTSIAHKTSSELVESLNWELKSIAYVHNIDINEAPTNEAKFTLLVKELAKTAKVVLLIDEYDKPILDHLSDMREAESQRTILRSFYDSVKGLDPYLKAIFITGVSKFAKTSIFSGINNLNDISLKPEGASLLGYTAEEIKSYFGPFIGDIARHEAKQIEIILRQMKHWYNGYSFSEQQIKVYNPYSVLYCLKDKKFGNYWFESGTPSFLISLIKSHYYSLSDLQKAEVSLQSLSYFEISSIPLIPLLFQTGYLTITSYNRTTDKFTLGYPNLEVEESFTKYLVAVMAETSTDIIDTTTFKLIKALDNKNIEEFCIILQTLFAQIPYVIQNNKKIFIEKESYYHAFLQFLMSFLNIEMALETSSEILTNQGRIDLVTTTKDYIYIFELKVNSNPAEALRQIHSKKYYERYTLSNKKIILIGLAFNFKENKNKLSINCKSEEI